MQTVFQIRCRYIPSQWRPALVNKMINYKTPENEIGSLSVYSEFLNDSGCQRQLEEKLALALCKHKEAGGPEHQHFARTCTSDDVRTCFGGQTCPHLCHASCRSRKIVAGWCALILILQSKGEAPHRLSLQMD